MPELLTRAPCGARRPTRRGQSDHRGLLCAQLLRGILERDTHGYIVLVRGHDAEWEAALRACFASTLGVLAERVLFIDSVPAADFLELLGLADVMLDPLHFIGMHRMRPLTSASASPCSSAPMALSTRRCGRGSSSVTTSFTSTGG